MAFSAARILATTTVGLMLCTSSSIVERCSAQTDDDELQQQPGDELQQRKEDAQQFFRKRVTPFIKTYCLECHQNKRPTEAGLSFNPALDTPGHAAFSEKWKKAAARVRAHDMPPDGLDQPTDEEREMFLQWLDKVKYLSPKDPGPFIIRRLTKTEYSNTLHDLYGVDPQIADSLPDEVSGEGYLNSLSPLQIEQYLSIAEQVLDRVIPLEGSVALGKVEAQNVDEIDVEDALGGNKDEARAATQRVVRALARSAFRRPPSEAEINVLMDVYALGTDRELSNRESLRLMLKALLVSPQFLYITPADIAEGESTIIPLDDYQLASRLSYLLWATMPDRELAQLADEGRLHELPVLQAQVKRMLADPRSRALFDGFGAQWLGVGDLATRAFDPVKFPQVNEPMRAAMYDEVRFFFENVMRENLSVAEFIDSDYTYLNAEVAKLYGMDETVSGSAMRRVELADRNRGGVLGMPGVLAATSFPNRTSPVVRGVWVLEQILGDHVPSPPPDVPTLESQDKQFANLTLREQTELHRTDPVCANCHKLLDPIGFGLENFDAIGRWRAQDEGGQAIDAAGELPDGSRFSNPYELKVMLSGRLGDVSRNLVEKLLAYALCRRLEGYDEIVVDRLMQQIADDDFRMQALITAVVTSYPFTHRRTE